MKTGWEVRPLGEVADFVMGQAPAGKDCNKDGTGTPFVKAGEFGEDRPIIREWTTDPKKMALSTDVLICVVGATCGKINLGADCAIGRSAAAIRPYSEKLDQFFLHYFLEGKVQEFRGGALGAAQTVISKTMLAEMVFPIPPLEEQKQIVAVLDAAFEGLTRAKENAEANLQNARELLGRFVDTIFTRLEASPLTEVQDRAKVISGYSFSSADFSPSNAIKSIKITNVGVQSFNASESAMLPLGYEVEFKRFSVASGSIVIALTRSVISGGLKFAVVPHSFEGALLNQRVAALTEFEDDFTRDYFFLYLSSSAAASYVIAKANTTMQPNLSINDLKKMKLPWPSIEIRKALIAKAQELSDRSKALEAEYTTKLADIADLRQSLLQKAFAGELT